MLVRDFFTLKLMKVLFVLLVAALAEGKVLACRAVEAELTPLYGLLAAIAGEPHVIHLIVLVFDALLEGLSELTGVGLFIDFLWLFLLFFFMMLVLVIGFRIRR